MEWKDDILDVRFKYIVFFCVGKGNRCLSGTIEALICYNEVALKQ